MLKVSRCFLILCTLIYWVTKLILNSKSFTAYLFLINETNLIYNVFRLELLNS